MPPFPRPYFSLLWFWQHCCHCHCGCHSRRCNCWHHPPCLRLLLPPITASTPFMKSSAIVVVVAHPSSPSSITAVKRQHLLLPPAPAAVECHLCCCHLFITIKCPQTLLLQSNAPACHRHCPLPQSNTAVDCAAVHCAAVAGIHCHHQTPTPIVDIYHLPPSNVYAHNYNARGCNTAGSHRTTISS